MSASTTLSYAQVASPLGGVEIYADGNTLVALDFADCKERTSRILNRRYGEFTLRKDSNPAGALASLDAYFSGDETAFNELEIDPGGTAFQAQVWTALRKIPWGVTCNYGELARRVKRPTASRAVGAANGQNPIALVLPCHRVIGANGSLTGYAGGLERKHWLLKHEGALLL